ncbi:MAG: tRNA uridine-5-carboxymethylaminomethyl(34) synthesis enzyme MnmG [Candidatus Delongbacteria bacterium]|nr:tRNA uridine-5-carboxymethylaminomethyl(34) synthesis enzyme MnmG [Candidatus Delongbacteria bacterium]
MLPIYDVIVVGAGHAGCEAAAAAANLGSNVLLVTIDMNKIAQMSCNPAMGGVAKGQIVKELDALGGYSGEITDKAMIQFRMLNRSKGPAMWSPRAQCDRMVYSLTWREYLEQIPTLDFWQGNVKSLIFENDKIAGVRTTQDIPLLGKSVILTTGTFLNGLMHVGQHKEEGGRAAEPPAKGLTQQLSSLGFTYDRMKTGTPVRIDGRTVDLKQLIEQKGDDDIQYFSFLHSGLKNPYLKQMSCFICETSNAVHEVLSEGLNASPLYDGTITSIGPRYCPSIETKLQTFPDKDRHLLFLEPEGLHTNEYYLNGFSSSLPWDVQLKALKQIKGFEHVKIYRPGYAIEYDFFHPTQLKASMETKGVENLYFAGQINGTTGYEEAGAQGIIAGINAHQKLNKKASFTLNRDQAYIGVLIDDLITKGVDEPYRMFTSRAEYRILLRQDNADIRLTELSHNIGLASAKRMKLLERKIKQRDDLVDFTVNFSCKPDYINTKLQELGTSPLKQKMKLKNILTRPQVHFKDMEEVIPQLKDKLDSFDVPSEILQAAEIQLKYQGYIERERMLADKMHRLENITIHGLDYDNIQSLSTEGRQKLKKIQPKTIGQASRISGVSPSDISVLLVYIGR